LEQPHQYVITLWLSHHLKILIKSLQLI